MQVTKGTWCMCEQCVQGSLSSSSTQEPGNKAKCTYGSSTKCKHWLYFKFVGTISKLHDKNGYTKTARMVVVVNATAKYCCTWCDSHVM